MTLALLTLLSTGYASDTCSRCGVEKVRGNHYTIYTELIIDASPEVVWSILTDWEQLPEWSPTIQGVIGDISDGGQTVVTYISPTNGKQLLLEHTLVYKEGVEFGWSDPLAGRVYDNHRYRVEAMADGRTLFIQSDEVNGGLLARIAGGGLSKALYDSYLAFNTALQARAEYPNDE